MVQRVLYVVLLFGLMISGCKQGATFPTSSPPVLPTGALTPFFTLTPSPTSRKAAITPIIPVTPAPSPTPFLHTIKDEDTMLGIAYKYGISLEELQAANPGVDPHFLSVGKQLVIPLNGKIPETMPTPTPAQVILDDPYCYPSGHIGAWCILPIKNSLEADVENISAWIGIFTSEGKEIGNQIIFAPMNILRSGETIPLMTYFDITLPENYEVKAELLSSLIIPNDDPRYIDLEVRQDNLMISEDGKEAEISGEVMLQMDDLIPSQVWILAVGYDAIGNIVGVRKWESQGEMQFDVTIYSLAGSIDHVDILTEVRPKQ